MNAIEQALFSAPLVEYRKQYFEQCLDAARPDGHVLEFGVHLAQTTWEISTTVWPELVWGFDSFQGLPEAWDRGGGLVIPQKHFAIEHHPEVQGNVRLSVGWFSDTLPKWLAEHEGLARFIHIDSDLYSSARTILCEMNDRIVPGTVIAFDELYESQNAHPYPNWREGEWKALMEWTEHFNRKWRFLIRREPERAAIIVEA